MSIQILRPFFRASLVAQTVKNLSAMWETWVQSPGREDPLEKRMAYPLQYSSCSHEVELYEFFIYFGYYPEGLLLKYSSV